MTSSASSAKTKALAPKKTFTDTNANSFSDKVLRWELLETRLAAKLDTMPHVKPVHDQLVQLIEKAKGHEFDMKAAKASVKQATADRKALIRTGEGIRSRLASALAFEHGATSALLEEFGLRPRKAGGRKKNAGQPPSPEPTPKPQPEILVHPGPQVASPVADPGAKAST